MQTHFQSLAQALETTPAAVQARFTAISRQNRGAAGRAGAIPTADLNFDTSHITHDNGTRTALHTLYAEAAQEAALRDALGTRCPQCGQFAGNGHICSTPEPEPIATQPAPQASVSPEASEATHPINPLHDTGWVAVQPEASVPTPAATPVGEPGTPRARRNPVRTYLVNGRLVRMDNLSAVRSGIAPRESVEVNNVEVVVSSLREDAPATVTGSVWVTNTGRRRTSDTNRFTTQSQPHQLACDCPQYREMYSCLHLAEATSQIESLINDRETHEVIPAIAAEQARQERVANREASLAAQEAALRGALGTRCPQCGEFAGTGHICSTPEPELTPTSLPVATPLEVSEVAPVAPPENEDAHMAVTPVGEHRTRLAQRNPVRTYAVNGMLVRMDNLSTVRGGVAPHASLEVRNVEVVVPPMSGEPHGTPATVTGDVVVANTGRRRTNSTNRFAITSDSRSLACNCAQYRETYFCPHLADAQSQMERLINDRQTHEVIPATAVERVRQELVADYQASLAAQQEARDNFAAIAANTPDYAENMEAFQQAWDEAKAQLDSGDTNLPYLTEDVTGGLGARVGGRSFGIEIEIDFPDDTSYTAKAQVAREIYEAGLAQTPDVQPWHHAARTTDTRGRPMGGGYSDNPARWSVEFDRSVDGLEGRRGCEIVSPILYDEPQTWENIAKVTEIVERNGGQATPRTGFHVNVGAADFDHTVDTHNRLLRLSTAYEDVILRMAHNPQSGAQHRGRHFCGPSTVPEAGFTRISQAQANNSHLSMVNLDHVPSEGNPITNSTRVEVRIFDGTTDKGRMQTDIKVALGLVNAATRGVEPGETREPAGTHRNANIGGNGRMRRLTGENWENDTASTRRFLDTLFSREIDKKQAVVAFAASRWQRQ